MSEPSPRDRATPESSSSVVADECRTLKLVAALASEVRSSQVLNRETHHRRLECAKRQVTEPALTGEDVRAVISERKLLLYFSSKLFFYFLNHNTHRLLQLWSIGTGNVYTFSENICIRFTPKIILSFFWGVGDWTHPFAYGICKWV